MEELRDRFLRFCSFFVFKSLLLSVALSDVDEHELS